MPVRQLGVYKWIVQQLHPERISENPALEAKLKPLESMNLPMWQIMEKYSPQPLMVIRPPSQIAMNSLTPQIQARLRNGSVDERMNTLAGMDSDTRRLVLAGATPPMLCLPPRINMSGSLPLTRSAGSHTTSQCQSDRPSARATNQSAVLMQSGLPACSQSMTFVDR